MALLPGINPISGQDYLHVQYIQRGEPAGVQYLLQNSPDLLSWNTSPASFSQVGTSDNGDGTSLVTLRLQSPTADMPRLFVRNAVQR